jgi:hypothetical protein
MIRKTAGDFIAYRLLVLLLTVLFLASCHFDEQPSGIEGSGTRKAPPPSPTPSPPSPRPGAPSSRPGAPSPSGIPHTHGRFVGTVKIGDTTYFGDALITVDGAVRLFVGAPGSNDGALQVIKPSVSEQFVGTVTLQGTAASGTGVVMGQYCAGVKVPGPYCGKNAAGEIHLTMGSSLTVGLGLQGDVQVANGAPEWILDLGYWPNYYELPATPYTGELREDIAEFSTNGDTIITFDGNGSLFFQSVSSGCVGNGVMRRHLDGHYGVYDVSLTLANSKPPYTYLNGEYAGLAADSAGNYWDYDDELRIWVSSTTAGLAAPALTMLATPAL